MGTDYLSVFRSAYFAGPDAIETLGAPPTDGWTLEMEQTLLKTWGQDAVDNRDLPRLKAMLANGWFGDPGNYREGLARRLISAGWLDGLFYLLDFLNREFGPEMAFLATCKGLAVRANQLEIVEHLYAERYCYAWSVNTLADAAKAGVKMLEYVGTRGVQVSVLTLPRALEEAMAADDLDGDPTFGRVRYLLSLLPHEEMVMVLRNIGRRHMDTTLVEVLMAFDARVMLSMFVARVEDSSDKQISMLAEAAMPMLLDLEHTAELAARWNAKEAAAADAV